MTPAEKRAFARTLPVHVGVDTGKSFHVLVAQGPDGRRTKGHKVLVGRQTFEQADAQLQTWYPDVPREQMLIGLEFAGHHGFTFARYLADRGYHVVNVLPAHTHRAKEIEDNSPLKSDAKDAEVVCSLLSHGVFVRFPFLKRPYVELRLLTTHRHRLTVEATRFKNRLQGLLDLAWPEFLSHFCDLQKVTPLAVLERWPLPRDILAASPRTVRSHIHVASRGHILPERIKQLLTSAQETVGLPDAPDERRLEIQFLLKRWALVREQMTELDRRIVALVDICPEAKVLLTVPEVSAVCAATLVAELGTPQDFEHPRQVLKLAGMNLVSSSSGQRDISRVPKWQSKRGRPALRRQLFLLAGRWCHSRGLYRSDYEALVARGSSGTKAVCTLARKLVPMLLVLMQSKTPFDVERWRANRRQPEAA
ncbi:MAG: IS110 family transposase [Gemmatimonadales bacterium]|jgi:transposase